MTKTEIMENYTAEQLAEMVINLQSASEVKNDEIHKLKWKISSLEEENGRLQSKLDTYNNYLLPRCTKEAKEMIDHNHFSGVRVVTWEQWNNRRKADGKVCFPKEYGQTVREFLNTDTSEIQDDCHRFGIGSLQRYLKNPAPIKIPKRDDKNTSISDIQKCQEEYEKLLKESPLEGVMNKITKDILEQKNNAMAMEFTRIICDLLRRYGVHVHYTETKLSENITHNSIEEKYGIVFDSMDFSQNDKELMDKIKELEEELAKSEEKRKNAGKVCVIVNGFAKEYPIEEVGEIVRAYEEIKLCKEMNKECKTILPQEYLKVLSLNHTVSKLQSEVGKYRKAFEDAKKERDCQIAEYRKKIEELEEYADSLKCGIERKQYAINQIDGIICELFGVSHNGDTYSGDFKELLREKSAVGKTITDFLPTEPIKVADILINAEGEYEHNPLEKAFCGTDKGTYRIFEISELRQIAEHLLIYCNHNREAEE